MSEETLLVFRGPDFLTGLGAGVAALIATWSWSSRTRRGSTSPNGRRRPAPVPAGVLFAVAATVALIIRGYSGLVLAAGVGLLVLAGAWVRRSGLAPAACVGVVGILVLSHATPLGARSIEVWVLTALALLAVPLVVRAESLDPGGAPVYMALAVLGLFLTVPDTETPAVLLGMAVPLGLVAWPRPIGRLGTAGAAALAGLLVYGAGQGGWARPGTMIASVACLGVMIVLTPVSLAGPGARLRLLAAPLELRGLLQLAVVFLASRAFVAHDLETAAILEGSFLAVLTVVGIVLARTGEVIGRGYS